MTNNKTKAPNDLVWTWSLFVTAIGAGVLYLPVNAGLNGIWPLIVLSLISVPMLYLPHRNLSRVVLSASKNTTNINDIIYEHFSPRFCNLFALCYFLAIYPLILIYSVGLTNTIHSFISNIFNIDYIPKALLSFLILFPLLIVIITKPRIIRRVTKFLALPLAFALFSISVYLIPKWNLDYFYIVPTSLDFIETLWLTIPVVIFSFNFSPLLSTFTLDYINRHPDPNKGTEKVLWRTSCLLFVFIMFFVFSCVLSVDSHHMLTAKQVNLNILIYMGNLFDDPFLHIISPIIAVIAMTGAFLGTFFGAKEAVIGLLEQKLHIHKVKSNKLDQLAVAIIFIPSYIFCILDTNILNIISILCGPVIALLLFVFPIYAIYNIKSLEKYRNSTKDKISNYFILIIGLISCSAILYSFYYLRNFLK